jgi:hypothetical protein
MEGVEWIWDAGLLKAQSQIREATVQETVAVIEKQPEEIVDQAIKETKKTINKFVDQKRLDEKKLEIFQNFLSNL